MRAGARISFGVDDHDIGVGTVRHPHLASVQNITIAALHRAKPHVRDVGSGARLRHRQRADVATRDEIRQISPLLFVRAVTMDLIDAEIGMGAVGQSDRR